ncbi:YDG SRA domain-containing protein [Rutstroemia sp. NJR-2017a BBW]|nr:YDG SRA domain-containing protein [Rutstroemia sp. NJR-2017a BBW]
MIPFSTAPEPDYLLEISDSIRQQLRQDVFPMHDIQLLDLLIDDLLSGDTPIEIIARARLDKIIDEILQHVKQNFLNQEPAFQEVMRKAASLQAHWLHTFKEKYHTMDAERLKIMKVSGCLHNMEMSFDDAKKIDGPQWQATKIETFSEMEANEHFEPGAWFLNVQCAIRDGIVRQGEEFTEGTSGKPVAFSLLSGMEIRGAVPGQWIHVIESTTRMYHSVRLTYVGCVIRLLRGHKLKSERAPRAGVRYDGFYKIESWGHVLLRLNGKGPDVYRNTLTLMELPGQKSMQALDEIPCPWQSDNWEIYNRMIASEKKNKEGEAAYKEYRDAEAAEEFARRVFVEQMKSLGPHAHRALGDTTRQLDVLPLQRPLRGPVMPAPPAETLRTSHQDAMPTHGTQ